MAEYCCKVGHVIEKYNLTVPGPLADDIDEYLAARWLGHGEASAVGVRQLATWFNKRLLRKIYVEHDRSVTETRIDSEYEALTGDDDPRRQEILDDLERDGINGEEVIDDMISRSTIARHLKTCLELEKDHNSNRAPQHEEGGGTWARDKIEYGRRHFRQSVEQAIIGLSNKGELPGGKEAEIELPVLVSCPECATRVPLSTALDRGYICSDHLGTVEDSGERGDDHPDDDPDNPDNDRETRSVRDLMDSSSSA